MPATTSLKFLLIDEKISEDKLSTQDIILPALTIVTVNSYIKATKTFKEVMKQDESFNFIIIEFNKPKHTPLLEFLQKMLQMDTQVIFIVCIKRLDDFCEKELSNFIPLERLVLLKKPLEHTGTISFFDAILTKLKQQQKHYNNWMEEQFEKRTNSLQQTLLITRSTLESSLDGILVQQNQNLLDYNQNLIAMFNIPAKLIKENDATQLLNFISEKIEANDGFLKLKKKIEHSTKIKKTSTLKCKNHNILEIHTQPYKINKKIVGRIWCFRDITQRARFEEHLQYQATHDLLTGLPNRVLLLDRLSQLIFVSKRNKHAFGLLFFDLDGFKFINDRFNHTIGDNLLQSVVQRVRLCMREEDTLARLGGDEFVVIIKSLNAETDAGKIAQKLLDVLKTPFIVNGHSLLITPSIGIASFPQDGETITELLKKADMAMYRAKEKGGNQFQFYRESIGKKSLERLEWEAELYTALEKKQFFLCYQPKLNMISEKIVSAEAFIRWNHPKKGIILPKDFLPLAEKNGLIIPIGEWVLREACRQNKFWQKLGLSSMPVAVNVSAKQLAHPSFVETVQRILVETDLDPKFLEIEIAESSILDDEEGIEIFRRLKSLGIHLTLDDFGLGLSNFNHLKLYPLDAVKIDQSYINNILVNKTDRLIIRSIISLAKKLKLDILAEGVESQEQMNFLKTNHCSQAQGYYYCKPLRTNSFEKLLISNIM